MKTRTVDLTISSFSKKGNGLGTWISPQECSYTVEVPFTSPGDKVQVQIERKHSGVYPGKLEQIIEPSPDRITPKCVHFGVCGGCRFQHLNYQKQLEYKSAFIKKCFAPFLASDVELREMIPSPKEWEYRNKMEYSFSTDKAGKKYLGLIIDSSQGKVLNLTECHLTHHWFIEALKTVRQWWHETGLEAYHMHKDSGSLRTLTVREGQRTGDRMVILTVSGNPDYAIHKKQLETFIAFLRDTVEPVDPNCQFSIFLRIQQATKGMPTSMYEMLLYGQDHIREDLVIDTPAQSNKIRFHISPSAFFQPNSLQAEKVYSHALILAEATSEDVVYDLYCGTGALGIAISKHVKQVIGIELSPESSLDARENAKRNQCHNVTIMTGDVGKVLREEKLPKPNIVMVDPPRAGLDSHAVKHIVGLQPEKIVYVSCNPITQAANIAEFVQQGYKVSVIQPIDQFPQTYHVENVVLLTQNSGY